MMACDVYANRCAHLETHWMLRRRDVYREPGMHRWKCCSAYWCSLVTAWGCCLCLTLCEYEKAWDVSN